MASGRIAHLFVFYGYKGASEDPNKLALANKLLQAVICEARDCGTGQPVIFAGDFNVELGLIPVVAKAFGSGRLVDLEAAYAHGRGVPPAITCKISLDDTAGTRWDFFLARAPMLWLPLVIVRFFKTGGSAPISVWLRAFTMEFGLKKFGSPGWYLLLPLLAGWRFLTCRGLLLLLQCRRFGLNDVRNELRRFCITQPDVDAAWNAWSSAAEAASLLRTRLRVVLVTRETLPFLDVVRRILDCGGLVVVPQVGCVDLLGLMMLMLLPVRAPLTLLWLLLFFFRRRLRSGGCF